MLYVVSFPASSIAQLTEMVTALLKRAWKYRVYQIISNIYFTIEDTIENGYPVHKALLENGKDSLHAWLAELFKNQPGRYSLESWDNIIKIPLDPFLAQTLSIDITRWKENWWVIHTETRGWERDLSYAGTPIMACDFLIRTTLFPSNKIAEKFMLDHSLDTELIAIPVAGEKLGRNYAEDEQDLEGDKERQDADDEDGTSYEEVVILESLNAWDHELEVGEVNEPGPWHWRVGGLYRS